jgi:hypothetical protein
VTTLVLLEDVRRDWKLRKIVSQAFMVIISKRKARE